MHPFKKLIFQTPIEDTFIPPTMTTYSYEGIYASGDSFHPSGGSLSYVDYDGVTQNLTYMWSGTCTSFQSQSAPTNLVAVSTCTTIYSIYISNSTSISNCAGAGVSTYPINVFVDNTIITVGNIIYNNTSRTIPFAGDGTWYHKNSTFSMKINSSGVVTEIDDSCAIPM